MSEKSIRLTYVDVIANSSKEYRLQLEKDHGGYIVLAQWGRINSALQDAKKTPKAVPLDEATRIFDRLVAEKLSKGYRPDNNGSVAAPVPPVATMSVRSPFMPELLEEIAEEQIDTYLESPLYYMEVKANGHRRQVQKLGLGKYTGFNKKGEPVALPALLVKDLDRLEADSFFLDGELIGDDLVVYDLLEIDGTKISGLAYQTRCEHRRKLLHQDYRRSHVSIVSTWKTKFEKRMGFQTLKKCRAEGVVFKLIASPYKSGRVGPNRKVKFTKTATFKVVRTGDRNHNSATLALLNDGKWREMGNASLIGKDQRIAVGSLVEAKFLYVDGPNGRLVQPRIIGLRTDVDESECTMAQLKAAYKGVTA